MDIKIEPGNPVPPEPTVLEIVLDRGVVSWGGGTCHATDPPTYDAYDIAM